LNPKFDDLYDPLALTEAYSLTNRDPLDLPPRYDLYNLEEPVADDAKEKKD